MTAGPPDGVAAALGDLTGLAVVDLGCGEGAVARWAVRSGAASVLALDLDADALDRARAHAGREGGALGRIHHEQADLEQATLPFEAYDLAHCPVVHRLLDPVRFARMTRAGLCPGGRLVAAVPATEVDRVVAALRTGGLEVPGGPGPGPVVVVRKPPRGG